MTQTKFFQREHLLRIVAGAALLIGFAATLRVFLLKDGFGEDEFFQIAFINESIPYFFVQIARLDQHPPFHFLQLKMWAEFFSSDSGLLFNSIAWHGISCATIFWVGRAWLGVTAGLIAAALYALVPQVVSASVELRFYSMIPTLAVGAWWINTKLLNNQRETLVAMADFNRTATRPWLHSRNRFLFCRLHCRCGCRSSIRSQEGSNALEKVVCNPGYFCSVTCAAGDIGAGADWHARPVGDRRQ